VRTPQKQLLIDTGYGSRLSDRERKNFHAEDGNPLFNSLAEIEVAPDDIALVVLTHLHFDHAGGGVLRSEDGELRAAFPHAEYVVQRGEWELATAGHPELRNAYPADNLEPLQDSGQLRLIDPDAEIASGIHGLLTPGHTEFHQSIRMESGDGMAIYLGDLCPSSLHLPSLWCMSYDTHMIETRRTKPRVLGEIAERDGWALFDHDPKFAAARLQRDQRKDFVAGELLETV